VRPNLSDASPAQDTAAMYTASMNVFTQIALDSGICSWRRAKVGM
jgi:hypothetical protein